MIDFNEAMKSAIKDGVKLYEAILESYGMPIGHEVVPVVDQIATFLQMGPEEESRIAQDYGPAGLARYRDAMTKLLQRRQGDGTTN